MGIVFGVVDDERAMRNERVRSSGRICTASASASETRQAANVLRDVQVW